MGGMDHRAPKVMIDTAAPCLYLIIPKSMMETVLRTQFEKLGPLKVVSMMKDKVTNTSRGSAYAKLAYIKFFQLVKDLQQAILLDHDDPEDFADEQVPPQPPGGCALPGDLPRWGLQNPPHPQQLHQ